MAYILHIDTSGDVGTVAISKDGLIISSMINADTRNHAATINLHIEKALQDAGIKMADLDVVAICGGPGSYTGLRIGLATAKGICYLLDKPLMMHHKLLLLALEGIYNHKNEYAVFAGILTAREGEYYFASYDNHANVINAPQHILQADLQLLVNEMKGKCLLAGDFTDTIRMIFTPADTIFGNNTIIDLPTWAIYAAERYNCNEFVNLANIEPFYLKQVYTHNTKNIN